MKLAMIPLEKEAFKAPLIACSQFKRKVIDILGWPVYSVIPPEILFILLWLGVNLIIF